MNDWEKEYEKSAQMAQRHFRKDVSGFRERRRLELEDLLRIEQEKPEDMRDEAKIRWILEELQNSDG
ncbi:hypothetical protein [Desulfosoma caldarium]|uniref:Uncharacterized protein n=1 Tax=Desulfosoma caldarium TaxID=610254 RepID=A0A3N1VKN8_9BACT|nr:hypothetical protein [Desulfosoma caldarium]ROR01568.1 hypothetical protein EDC27_0747 [Desulfosoma caldarium]